MGRFDETWKKAYSDAGIGVKVFHDFRRTAVRNMVRLKISEKVVMMISGNKTLSIVNRYDFVKNQDLKLAIQMQSEYVKILDGHKLGTVPKMNDVG